MRLTKRPSRASAMLLMALTSGLTGLTAGVQAEAAPEEDFSLFDYLGAMVEEDGELLDMMEIVDLPQLESEPAAPETEANPDATSAQPASPSSPDQSNPASVESQAEQGRP